MASLAYLVTSLIAQFSYCPASFFFCIYRKPRQKQGGLLEEVSAAMNKSCNKSCWRKRVRSASKHGMWKGSLTGVPVNSRLGWGFFLVCNGTKCDTRNEVRYHYSASFIVRNVKGYSSFLSGNFFFFLGTCLVHALRQQAPTSSLARSPVRHRRLPRVPSCVEGGSREDGRCRNRSSELG